MRWGGRVGGGGAGEEERGGGEIARGGGGGGGHSCLYLEPPLGDLLDFREHFSPEGEEKPNTDDRCWDTLPLSSMIQPRWFPGIRAPLC